MAHLVSLISMYVCTFKDVFQWCVGEGSIYHMFAGTLKGYKKTSDSMELEL